ncbi:MAG: TIR domain-containing protein [Lachnospiraceae bacterium]|nr:TIR domain-containing protein [Lachnospiraceae bacterium]
MEEFIFISYAHKDAERVMPVVNKLKENGYRVWYDDEIHPGSEWPRIIGDHLIDCKVFFAFISKNYVASKNCQRELTLAQSEGKEFVAIFLEEVELDAGMKLQLSVEQSVFMHKATDMEAFYRKLFVAAGIETCKSEKKTAEVKVVSEKKTVTKTQSTIEKEPEKETKHQKDASDDKNSVKIWNNLLKYEVRGKIFRYVIILDVCGDRQKIEEISIPKKMGKYPVKEIGVYAFSACLRLKSVDIPANVTRIGAGAFHFCVSLEEISIPASITRIEEKAFQGAKLTNINIPKSVTYIGKEAFSFCRDLVGIAVATGNRYYDSRNDCNAVIETKTNTLIRGCRNTKIPNDVTRIGMGAFSGCDSLTSIIVPESVTHIENEAFSFCGDLVSITVATGNRYYDSRNNCNAVIETKTNTLIRGCRNTKIPNDVTRIGIGAFSGCESLTSIIIPEGVTSIGPYAFRGSDLLTSISLPESVTSIGRMAFGGCHNLTNIRIPKNTIVAEDAFANCPNLTINRY